MQLIPGECILLLTACPHVSKYLNSLCGCIYLQVSGQVISEMTAHVILRQDVSETKKTLTFYLSFTADYYYTIDFIWIVP